MKDFRYSKDIAFHKRISVILHIKNISPFFTFPTSFPINVIQNLHNIKYKMMREYTVLFAHTIHCSSNLSIPLSADKLKKRAILWNDVELTLTIQST